MNGEEIFKELSKRCEINKTVEFDVSVPILDSDAKAKIFIGKQSFVLADLNISIEDIEQLNRSFRIVKIRNSSIKNLKPGELSHTTYSIFTQQKTEENSPPKLLQHVKYIALIGGVFTTILGITMMVNRVNLVGYDTFYGGGYGYQTLTPIAAIIIGGFMLFISLLGFINQAKRKRR